MEVTDMTEAQEQTYRTALAHGRRTALAQWFNSLPPFPAGAVEADLTIHYDDGWRSEMRADISDRPTPRQWRPGFKFALLLGYGVICALIGFTAAVVIFGV
jgi:hypothetical protein